VEQQHVAGFERDEAPAVEQILVFGQVFPEELVLVKLVCVECHGVAAGDDLQRAVLGGFRSQCQPGADQLGALKRPVAEILVPGSSAGEPGLLGHDTIVVGQGQDDIGADQLGHTGQQGRVGRPRGKEGMPVEGLLQPSDRRATVGLAIRRRTGVSQVGFILAGALRILEFVPDHCEQLVARHGRGHFAKDDKAVAIKVPLFFGGEMADFSVHGFPVKGEPVGSSGSRHEVSTVSTIKSLS